MINNLWVIYPSTIIVLVVLKLFDLVSLPWWLVLSPVWVMGSVMLVLLFIYSMAVFFAGDDPSSKYEYPEASNEYTCYGCVDCSTYGWEEEFDKIQERFKNDM